MRVSLLPSNCNDPGKLQALTTFLINDRLAIDAGSLGFSLSLEQQRHIRHIIITHSHSDHTASLPIFVAEIFPFLTTPVVVHGIDHVIDSLQRHIFNDSIWPDFGKIEINNGSGPALVYERIIPDVPFELEGLRFTPVETNHVVPSIGLAVADDKVSVIFTSDTYHTDEIWQLANRTENLRAIFVDVSYPRELENLAAVSKHLTPQSLARELTKLARPVPIYAVHLKPQFRSQVIEQLEEIENATILVADIGREYAW